MPYTADGTQHASGDTGEALLAVRKDVAGTLVDTDGDYTPLQVDANGALRVTSTGAAGGGLTDGELRATPVPVSGTVSVSEPVSVDDNGGSLTVDGSVSVSNFPAVQPVSDNGGSLTVDGAVSVSNHPQYQRPSSWLGVYFMTWINAGNTAATYNYLSLFNPAASGRNLVLLGVYVEGLSVAAAITLNHLRLFRTTAASVGTLITASTLGKFRTADASSVAEVRHTNPTVTTASATEVIAFVPNQSITAAGATAVSQRQFVPNPGWGEFLLAPGEGLALRQLVAGDADQQFMMTLVWAER